MAEKKPLAGRRRKFVELFTGECQGNATEAYIRAGFKYRDRQQASNRASEILRLPEVMAAVRDSEDATSAPLVASRQEIVLWLSKVIRGDASEEKLSKDGLVTVSVSIKDRIKAAELLCKMRGEFLGQEPDDCTQRDPEYARKLQEIFDTTGEEVPLKKLGS